MSGFDLLPDRHDVLQDQNKPLENGSLREKLYIIIFQSNTPAGKLFDISLFFIITLNIVLLMLESVDRYANRYHDLFRTLDNIFMIFFSVEYLLRLYVVRSKIRYARSFYGIVDLLAILPSYLEFIFPQSHMLMIVRSFRLLRIFRIFGMVQFLDESRYLVFALIRSFRKILVFLFFVVLLTIFMGSIMYVVEYEHNSGFTSIPQSIYWAIVTITTVGYGDIAPVTTIGKFIASFIMILGYAIIAVPTGIMSAAAISGKRNTKTKTRICPRCANSLHDIEALYCNKCGENLDANKTYVAQKEV